MTDAEFLEHVRGICPTKAVYSTSAEAKAMMRRRQFPGRPYACPWCDFWHITTLDRVRSKAFSRRLKTIRSLELEDPCAIPS
jgi:hypothetical protein